MVVARGRRWSECSTCWLRGVRICQRLAGRRPRRAQRLCGQPCRCSLAGLQGATRPQGSGANQSNPAGTGVGPLPWTGRGAGGGVGVPGGRTPSACARRLWGAAPIREGVCGTQLASRWRRPPCLPPGVDLPDDHFKVLLTRVGACWVAMQGQCTRRMSKFAHFPVEELVRRAVNYAQDNPDWQMPPPPGQCGGGMGPGWACEEPGPGGPPPKPRDGVQRPQVLQVGTRLGEPGAQAGPR